MSKLKIVEPLVKEILEENELTRGDDFLLVAEVYYRLVPEIANTPFSVVMLCHKDYGLPPTKSIERCRRKVQAKYNELKPFKKVQEARQEEQVEYFNYSINKED